MSNHPTLYQRITHRVDVLFDYVLQPFAMLFSHESNGAYIHPQQQNSLEDLRSRIKLIDSRIINDLAERLKICEEIGRLKIEKQLPIRDLAVEKMTEESWCEKARKSGITDLEAIRYLYRTICGLSIEVQEEVIAKEKDKKIQSD